MSPKPDTRQKMAIRGRSAPVGGELVTMEGEPFYKIRNHDRMPAFFLSVVSAEDHWMFLSSHGGLTAGRRDADGALFPYYTDDKLRDLAESTGGKTIVRVRRAGRLHVWEPFCTRGEGRYRVRRNLLKSVWGNSVIFEEENSDLGLVFRARWCNSRKFGWIRRSRLENTGRASLRVEFLDGIQNIMPSGIGSEFQLRFSTLLDAYKRNELIEGSRLALFRLSAVPADRPEPAEALSATVAWSIAPGKAGILLSSRQLDAFRSGGAVERENDVRGQRGSYLVRGEKSLRPRQAAEWMIGADVAQSAADIVRLQRLLKKPARFAREVLSDIADGTEELRRIVGSADGLQASALSMGSARHYMNTLCNVMRGGVFPDGENITRSDLDRHVRSAAPAAIARWERLARKLPARLTYRRLVRAAQSANDPCLERVCREYLPLTFSRRHGDPSRPWNRFTIPSRDASGRRTLDYEGNWRDIFQNWEALAQSFPGFTTGMISRFLNASTADGYNPYRITRDGIDWEVPEPHDPWACIGYWGDHQIIYLLKLLEHVEKHDPGELENLLEREILAYANVPYRIRDYRSLVANPKDTVVFDERLEKIIKARVRRRGAEGKLLLDAKERVVRANLSEKLLVPLLAKLSNFVPGAGLWLNTQRPEWNDANNALVGPGASVVTLAYVRRYLAFLQSLFAASPRRTVAVSRDIATFLRSIASALEKNHKVLRGKLSDRDRRRIADLLGQSGESYRGKVYARGIDAEKIALPVAELGRFLETALAWTDHTLRLNRRKDGLYHSYNLVAFEGKDRLTVRHLYEMLEGQVAILSSGLLSPQEAVNLLRSLRRSAMYRPDQHSYLLYPERQLPRFLERNNIPPREVRGSRLLRKLITRGDRLLVEKDVLGRTHFRPGIGNQRQLGEVLDQLAEDASLRALVQSDRGRVLQIYERIFDHQSFTGRSGTFYGYEGLGCIYWHMVSKLLLAVQEICFQSEREKAPSSVRRALATAYYDIRYGLGDAKTPQEYGAFPMEPYSHTPANAGAKQPGLTGQVKEDILCRLGELGVFVEAAAIKFRPSLLRTVEFPEESGKFTYYDTVGKRKTLTLPPGSIAFTVCQTPITYTLSDRDSLTVSWSDGSSAHPVDLALGVEASRHVLQRTGKVRKVAVELDQRRLIRSL
jgi:hypothetical protein